MKAIVSMRKGKQCHCKRVMQSAIAVAICAVLEYSCEANAQVVSGADLETQIQIYSAASQKADPPAMEPVAAGGVWRHLGSLYEDAGRYAESETCYVHAIRLLQPEPAASAELATAIDDLGTLYMMRGDLEQAEYAEQRALAIREAWGIRADLPLSWFHLATLSLREHQFKRARDYAELAVQQIDRKTSPDADEEMNARFVLGSALFRLHKDAEAIAMMESAMDVGRRTYSPDDFPLGFGSFLLGYVYWKSGNATGAAKLMENGAAVVERQLGWRHPVCLSVMTQYARFLRDTHQTAAARAIDDKLKEARGKEGYGQGTGTLSVAALF